MRGCLKCKSLPENGGGGREARAEIELTLCKKGKQRGIQRLKWQQRFPYQCLKCIKGTIGFHKLPDTDYKEMLWNLKFHRVHCTQWQEALGSSWLSRLYYCSAAAGVCAGGRALFSDTLRIPSRRRTHRFCLLYPTGRSGHSGERGCPAVGTDSYGFGV